MRKLYEKPKCTKMLALFASGLILFNCILDSIPILFPDIFIRQYMQLSVIPDIPASNTVLLIFGVICILPFLGVCLFNASTATISYRKSFVSLFLCAVFWIGSNYCTMFFINRAVVSGRKTELIATISAIRTSQGMIPDFPSISFALICSALAIEMYIATKEEKSSM